MGVGSVAVLGGGGHLGSAVVRAALSSGLRVTALVRQAVAPASLSGLGARVVRTSEHELLAGLVRTHELFVDAAAPYPTALFAAPRDSTPAELAAAHVRRVLGPVEALGVPLVHLGSWVRRAPRPGDPTAAFGRARHRYFEVKARIEDALLEAGARGLPVSVFTVTMAVGPWDSKPRPLCLVPQLVTGDHPVLPDAHLNLIDVRDLATVVLSLAARAPWGRVVPIVGHDLRLRTAAQLLAEVGGGPAPSAMMPTEAAVLALTAWETMHTSGAAPEGPPALGAMLLHEMEPGLEAPEQRALGLVLRPLRETLRDAVAWYRDLGYC
ncbi:NmrA family NAD(P)-binding protein [Myxococcota bacterium]|nr:NmrA family NAD(P)-binding protein [Myxococcota bacterium]